MEIDLWTRSRLAHYLDNYPTGQWLRFKFLDIIQEQLSTDLLQELSKKSLEEHRPVDDPVSWIPRELDNILKKHFSRSVTFLLAASGMGKSVACYRCLTSYLECGGFGLILTDDTIASSSSIEQAVTLTLRQLHPSLVDLGASALSFCKPEKPLLLIVEDINRSGQVQRLLEKLAGWSNVSKKLKPHWHLICPLWPESINFLREETQKLIASFIIDLGGFTEEEGREAVLIRARNRGLEISLSSADQISRELGYDPLLIALQEHDANPDLHQVIGQYIRRAISRVAANVGGRPATDYFQALRALGTGMLANRQIEPRWSGMSNWAGLDGEHLDLISHIARYSELIRFGGVSNNQHILFRHDRVRDWILSDAVCELISMGTLPEEIAAEPYFAEVMGLVLAYGTYNDRFLKQIVLSNPLALFYAFRIFGKAIESKYEAIIQAINAWLDTPVTHGKSNLHLRWEASALLTQTDSPEVPNLARKFHDQKINCALAKLRNGDVTGGIELCIHLNPGITAPWRDRIIEHAILNHGRSLAKDLSDFLKRGDLDSEKRIGALRFAGHLSNPSLVSSIERCWTGDDQRTNNLDSYLWAFAQCCSEDPACFLAPVCDAWAALSDQSESKGLLSPREVLAVPDLRWAFQRYPPVHALDYFAQRASQKDLKQPIISLLNTVDHPKAVYFLVHELADICRSSEGTSTLPPGYFILRYWQMAQERSGQKMSKPSRDLLLRLWQDEKNDNCLRTQAFSYWSANQDSDDLEVLRSTHVSGELSDKVLWERLVRQDKDAIPAWLEKLEEDENGYWWQCGRYLWSMELTSAIGSYFERRSRKANQKWNEVIGADWIVCEMVMKSPTNEVEGLLLKHWSHLRFCSDYVQAALYVATPPLLKAAQNAITESPEPCELLKQLSYHYEIQAEGRIGLCRQEQLLALTPYLQFLPPSDIKNLWIACNKRGWYALRHKLLDGIYQPDFMKCLKDQYYSFPELDKMTEWRYLRISYWIDGFIEAGVSWNEVLHILTTWANERRTVEALRVVAAAIEYQGSRRDLHVLKTYEGIVEEDARDLITDTQFAVYRRSIN